MTEPDLPGATPDQSEADGGQPIAGRERLVSLDFIRGVAVLGILFANITAFAHPSLAYGWPGALPGGGDTADRWIWLVQLVAVDGKFRGLFSLLFGAGLALFVDRARARGGSAGLQLRRLLLLAGFGLAHFYLLFTGDILFLYAVSGLVALSFVDWSPRKLFWLAIAWYLLLTGLQALALSTTAALEIMPALREAAPGDWAQVQAGWQAQLAGAEAQRAVMMGGSPAQIVAYRFAEQSSLLTAYVYLAFIDTIPLLLLGMALYRSGFFSGGMERTKMRRWAWAGVVSGAAATLALGLWTMRLGFPPQLTSFIANGATALPRLPMVLGLAALLTLWAPHATATWLGARLIAAGRMAFSNYICTSLLMALVFQGWAGGLYGTMHRADLLLVVALGWAVMLAWSQPWLARFRYGPLEWLWRCLTYGRLFPFRRRETPLATASNSH